MEIAKKYGAMFIFLPLDDKGVPKTALERINIINEFYTDADKYGFTKDDFTIDGIVMTVSSDQNAAKETLRLIKWCTEEFKVNTVVGLSNVSFGLPERKYINAGFLSMAIANGLTMAIANPNEELLMNMKFSCDVLVCNDVNSRNYIRHFGDTANIKKSETKISSKKPEELVYDSILNGDKENIVSFIKDAIAAGIEINKLIDDYLIKAINNVGELYEKKIYFLPQLISSAETMKTAFNYLEPLLFKNADKVNKNPQKIILATVKGDIHDIGKNIVGLMLKNYGYTIIDLGKDVDSTLIIDKAISENADIIGLSALMTTTMTEMKNVINIAKDKKIKAKIIIGGAVINEQYAEEIKADGYARDGFEAVKLVQRLLSTSIDTKK
jgi:5-methyltetrahydrofolate--homocysteine methyltransferase